MKNLTTNVLHVFATITNTSKYFVCLIQGTAMFLILTMSVSAAPIIFHVDNTHSSIQFTVPFFGVSEVAGRFDQFCGTFIYDKEKPEQASIILYILSSSINTGIGMRDRDLRETYFEVDKYPFIEFASNTIKRVNDKEFSVKGTLNMHGVAQEITFSLTTIGEITTPDGKEWGFKSSPIIIDRTVYGVNKGKLSADQTSVGNTVSISSFIRLRESPERRRFELAHPAVEQIGLEKFTGMFTNSAKAAELRLLLDKNKLFVIFTDKDWIWMREVFKTGENQLRIYSRNDLIELNDNTITLKPEGNEALVFIRSL
jgi:polyisoprenoid-binding protein YceI